MKFDSVATLHATTFDGTLESVFPGYGTIVTTALTWIMVAGLIVAIIGGLVAIILRRISIAMSHNNDKYEMIKRAEKTTIISICIIAGISILGTGAVWLILGFITGNGGDGVKTSTFNFVIETIKYHFLT